MRSRTKDSPRVDSRFDSIRRAATNSLSASARFVRASALVAPCVFTPGISSTHAIYPERTFLYTAVNICGDYTICLIFIDEHSPPSNTGGACRLSFLRALSLGAESEELREK